MQEVAYGTYKNGQIFLDSPACAVAESRVKITFLDKGNSGSSLMDVFNDLGPWEDNRDTETIIADIRNARVTKTDVHL
ncbi:MAG: hypothetical protein LBL73_06395 [Synergistaceae bacterium]|jgi:hypothetical protein|nr:hypothetical protein [Synergistaceae bacterium]